MLPDLSSPPENAGYFGSIPFYGFLGIDNEPLHSCPDFPEKAGRPIQVPVIDCFLGLQSQCVVLLVFEDATVAVNVRLPPDGVWSFGID